MSNKTILSSPALICILLCSRIFSTLTFFTSPNTGGMTSIIAVLVATVLQMVLLIPLIRLFKTCSADISTSSAKLGERFGKFVNASFLAFFLYQAFLDIGSFAYFTDYFFSVNMPRLLTVACCTLTAVYAARLDTAVIGRIAQLSVFLTALMLLTIAAGAADGMSAARFDLAVPNLPKAVSASVLSETNRCSCLVIFAFLALHTDDSSAVNAMRFLALKGVFVCTIIALVTAVLGNMSLKTPLPVFTLAASSENLITERSDAFFLMAWIFTGLVRLAALLHCAGMCIRRLFPETNGFYAVMSAGLVPAAAALPFLFDYRWESIVYSEHSLLPIVLLVSVLPLTILCVNFRTAHPSQKQTVQKSV